jgi:hypothetical protein
MPPSSLMPQPGQTGLQRLVILGEAEPDQALALRGLGVEGRKGDGGHALLGAEPAGEGQVREVGDPGVVHELEVGPGHGEGAEPGGGEAGGESVPPGLEKGAQPLVVLRMRPDHLRQRPLGRGEGGEGVALVDLPELPGEGGRGDAGPHLPAGAVVGLAEARKDEAPLGEAGGPEHALVGCAVEHHVLVDLVRQHEDVGGAEEPIEPRHVLRPQMAPEGLWGVFRTRSLVRGEEEMAASSRFQSTRKSSGIQGHVDRAPPARVTAGP